MIFSSALTMQEVKLIGRKLSILLAGLPDLRTGMIVACLHIWGVMPSEKESLKILRRVVKAVGPRAFRNKRWQSGPR